MSRGRVGSRIGERDTGQPNRTNANGVWGLQEVFDALQRSSWPTVLAPPSTGFGVSQQPQNVNASCTLSATFTANAYRTNYWEDPIAVSWQKATRNADTPITGNPWICDDPYTGWGDQAYANASFPPPYLKQLYTSITTSPSGDPFFKNVALLMPMDSGFTDVSQSARAFSVIPGASIVTNNKKYGAGSGFFDGTTGFVSTTSNAGMTIGTKDFTIDAWIYLLGPSTSGCIIAENHTGNPISIAVGVHGSGGFDSSGQQLFIACYGGWWSGWYLHLYSDISLPTNQWVHVVAQRSGTVVCLFADGKPIAAEGVGSNFSLPTPSNSFNVGRRWDTAGSNPHFNGNIDDLRVTNGAARYPVSFATPTSPLPTTAAADSEFIYVQWMFPFTTNLLDYSNFYNSNDPYTVVGSLPIVNNTASGPINGTSASFDGSSYLQHDWNGTAGLIGSGVGNNFTVEGWFNFSNPAKGMQGLLSHYSSSANGWALLIDTDSKLHFYAAANNSYGWAINLNSNFLPISDTWYHIAVVRKNSVISLFINGVLYAAQYYNGIIDSPTGSNAYVEIGSYPYFYGYIRSGFEGKMQQIRITNGNVVNATNSLAARYSISFTPPTATPPTAWAETDPYASDVVVFANFENGPNDVSDNGLPGVVSDSGALTNSLAKYGSYSLSNGSVSFSGDTTLPGSFTVEAWYYFNNVTTKRYLFSSGTLGASLVDFYVDNSNLYLQVNNGSPQTLPGSIHVYTGAWLHIALVRNITASASVIKCYVNGIYKGDFTYSGTVGDNLLVRNTYVFAAYNDFTDEFRITRAARYSANFNTPTVITNGSRNYYIEVSESGNRAINGNYYPVVSSNQSFNKKQFYQRFDGVNYCLLWSNGYWILHESDGGSSAAGSWQYYSDGYDWKTIQTNALEFAQPKSVTLSLSNLTFADNDTYYRILAQSGFQKTTSNAALLTVEPLNIVFTVEPQDTTVNTQTTGSVTFNATASGTGRTTGQTYSSFTYQWQKKPPDGTWQDIPFANGQSLTDTALTAADDGNQYRVRAGCGATNTSFSRVATLTVI